MPSRPPIDPLKIKAIVDWVNELFTQKGTRMRNPERIDRILNLLDNIWIHNPDLRLGQIITSAIRIKGPYDDRFSTLFYMEDEELEKCLLNLKNEFEKSDKEVEKEKP